MYIGDIPTDKIAWQQSQQCRVQFGLEEVPLHVVMLQAHFMLEQANCWQHSMLYVVLSCMLSYQYSTCCRLNAAGACMQAGIAQDCKGTLQAHMGKMHLSLELGHAKGGRCAKHRTELQTCVQ